MNVNRKFDRFKQWAGERMGGEVRTDLSDDFKALEADMTRQHDSMRNNQEAMSAYVKALSKRCDGHEKDRPSVVCALGAAMVRHGDEYEQDSPLGQELVAFGHANERIGRLQDTYATKASSSWLESLERSANQMKEYQTARKKLDSRRLAYDTAQGKMQKAKKEDFRVEEELRSQRVKFEEAHEEVYRRMLDIRESEADSAADLGVWLDAQLNYYQRSYEILLQLRQQWPQSVEERPQSARAPPPPPPVSVPTPSFPPESAEIQQEPAPPLQPPRPQAIPSPISLRPVAMRTFSGSDLSSVRPGYQRSATADVLSPARQPLAGLTRLRTLDTADASLNSANGSASANGHGHGNVIASASTGVGPGVSAISNSPDRSRGDVPISPVNSIGSLISAQSPSTLASSVSGLPLLGKKPPPPPPPPRAKKPAPPPPPPPAAALRRAVSAGGPFS